MPARPRTSAPRDQQHVDGAAAPADAAAVALPADREALLEAVFRRSPSFLAVLRGPGHVFVTVNDAYTRLVGGRAVVGRPVLYALPELRGQGFDALLDRVVATGEPFVGREVPIQLAPTPGAPPEERFVDFQYLPYVEADAAGAARPVGVIAHGVDVTDQVRARRALEGALAEAEAARAAAERAAAALAESEARFRAVQDTSPLGFAIHRPVRAGGAADGTVVDFATPYVNAAGARIVQQSRGAVMAGTLRDMWPATAAVGVFDDYVRVLETGEPSYRELRYEHDGLAAGLAITAGRLRAGPDAELGVTFSDITARLRADEEHARLLASAESARRAAEDMYEQAQSAFAEAERANRAKSEFLATMSHEVRTPINAIQGYAELLELGVAGPVSAQQRDYLGRLTTAGRHLLGLVNDVLDLAKVDAGELTVARHALTTGPVVDAALDLVRPQGAARGVRVSDGVPGDPGVPYVGDEHRVRQILVNLLSNAVKFTDAGGAVHVRAEVTPAAPAGAARGAGPWALVHVTDTGIGIAPEQQEEVFEPFHQVESGRTRTRGGTGLGLSISRRLARLMGGDLTLASHPGVGSTFTLVLPSATAAAGGAPNGGPPNGDGPAGPWPRGAPADRAAPAAVRGLGALGRLIRGQLDAILAAYADQMRADPAVPRAAAMAEADLEDHLACFIADLAQTLVMLGAPEADSAAATTDSTAIARVVAERHGARRAEQGWSEAATRRDYAALRDVLAQIVRARQGSGPDAEAALAVVLAMVERSERVAMAAYHAAAAG